jgi:hypothetical protein
MNTTMIRNLIGCHYVAMATISHVYDDQKTLPRKIFKNMQKSLIGF